MDVLIGRDYYISPRFLSAVTVRYLHDCLLQGRSETAITARYCKAAHQLSEMHLFGRFTSDLLPNSRMLPQMHIVKNYMADQLQGVNPPLILGIWGPKGAGKTFQTELALKKLGYARPTCPRDMCHRKGWAQ